MHREARDAPQNVAKLATRKKRRTFRSCATRQTCVTFGCWSFANILRNVFPDAVPDPRDTSTDCIRYGL